MDLFLSPRPCPLHRGDLCGLPSAPGALPVRREANVHLARAHGPALCASQSLCTVEVGMPPLSRHAGLCCEGCACWSLYASPLLAPQAAGLLWASPHSLSLPSGWVYSLWAVHGLKSAAFLCFLPSKALLCLVFQDSTVFPLGPTCKGASQCIGTPPVSGLPASLVAQGPSQDFSIFFLFMSPSSLLPHFRELNPPPGGMGSSAVT